MSIHVYAVYNIHCILLYFMMYDVIEKLLLSQIQVEHFPDSMKAL